MMATHVFANRVLRVTHGAGSRLTRLSIFGGKSGEFPKISLLGLHYIAVCEVQTEAVKPFGRGWA